MRWIALAAVAVLVPAAGAGADDVVVPVTVRPGRLVLSPAIVAARSPERTVTVVDARGSGAGWTIFARSGSPTGRAAIVTGVAVRCGPTSTCTLPRSQVRYPVDLGRIRAAPVLVALRGTGMGTVEVTLKFAAPAGAANGVSLALRSS